MESQEVCIACCRCGHWAEHDAQRPRQGQSLQQLLHAQCAASQLDFRFWLKLVGQGNYLDNHPHVCWCCGLSVVRSGVPPARSQENRAGPGFRRASTLENQVAEVATGSVSGSVLAVSGCSSICTSTRLGVRGSRQMFMLQLRLLQLPLPLLLPLLLTAAAPAAATCAAAATATAATCKHNHSS